MLVRKVRKPAGCHGKQELDSKIQQTRVTYSIFSALWQNQLCHVISDRSLA